MVKTQYCPPGWLNRLRHLLKEQAAVIEYGINRIKKEFILQEKNPALSAGVPLPRFCIGICNLSCGVLFFPHISQMEYHCTDAIHRNRELYPAIARSFV